MKVSTVVCTYNGEKFIKEQLCSIMEQTVGVDEIIICDDGSSDNTIVYVKEVLSTFNLASRIIINDKNLGISKNFENGIKHASGNIIFLSDQDDIWLPNKVEKHLSIYKQNADVSLIFSNAKLLKDGVFEKDLLWDRVAFIGKKKKTFYENQLNSYLIGWFVTGATVSVKREFVNGIIPFPDNVLHDQWLSFAAAINNSMFAEKECLIQYRQHSNQIVGTKKNSISQKYSLNIDYQIEANKFKSMISALKTHWALDKKIEKQIIKKINFLLYRQKLKSLSKVIRLLQVLKELFKGNYYKFTDSSIKSMVKDFLK